VESLKTEPKDAYFEPGFFNRKYRVNFDNREQFNEYRFFYENCSRELKREYNIQERTIIALLGLGWGREKIHRRTRPQISERQVEKMLKRYPFLKDFKRLLHEDCLIKQTDATHLICATLGIDGELTRPEQTD
jgi:hypothetical protein